MRSSSTIIEVSLVYAERLSKLTDAAALCLHTSDADETTCVASKIQTFSSSTTVVAIMMYE